MDKLVALVIITSLTSAMGEAKTDNGERRTLEDDIIARYPGYFKTEEEAKIMESHLQKLQYEFSKKIKPSVVYHACCGSNSSSVPYDTLEDVDGKTVHLAQFKTKKQYFPTETCVTMSNCVSCSCKCFMVDQLFTALVYKDYPNNAADNIELNVVKAPTFCRCYNNASPGDVIQDDKGEDSPKIPEKSHDTEL